MARRPVPYEGSFNCAISDLNNSLQVASDPDTLLECALPPFPKVKVKTRRSYHRVVCVQFITLHSRICSSWPGGGGVCAPDIFDTRLLRLHVQRGRIFHNTKI